MSENRAFFRDTVERIVTNHLSQVDIEAAEQRMLPSDLFTALEDNGVPLMLVPEQLGGIGADIGDVVAIMRVLGAAAAPGPLLETILGNALLATAGCETVRGPLGLHFVHEESPQSVYGVPWGGLLEQVVLVSPSGISLLAASAFTSMTGTDAAGEPRDTLEISGITRVSRCDTASALAQAAVLRAGQILGAVEWTLNRTIDYAGERRQFGREIAKFQVIQQMLAELSGHFLASSGILDAAAQVGDPTLVAACRARLADAADAAIAIGHQVHGALGFSKEYALNFRTRRLMAWRDDYGSVPHWRRALASGFIRYSREKFWPAVADAAAGLAENA